MPLNVLQLSRMRAPRKAPLEGLVNFLIGVACGAMGALWLMWSLSV